MNYNILVTREVRASPQTVALKQSRTRDVSHGMPQKVNVRNLLWCELSWTRLLAQLMVNCKLDVFHRADCCHNQNIS